MSSPVEPMASHTLHPVILCGGAGTRLWPLSRETYPKQFLALQGSTTMLQDTVLRLDGLDASVPRHAPWVVCNQDHRFLAAQQLRDIGVGGGRLLLEPCARNTAPALTLAALSAQAVDPHAVLLAMPADHVVADAPALQAAVEAAWPLACAGAMVTFGITPLRPETGYGYIQQGAVLPDGIGREIAGFTEKPNAERASAYVESGQYLWNAGLFMVRADQWLKALDAFQPDMLAKCQKAMAGQTQDADFIRPDMAAFAACPSDSIDYAVMEHLPLQGEALGVPARVVALDAGWSDLGAWDALWDVLDHDAQGNAHVLQAPGQVLSVDSHNTLVLAESALVATVGLSDVVVVQTPDAVLVVDKRRTQDVKKVVQALQAQTQQRRALAQVHRKVHRPWGWYDSIDAGERFQVKRIVVNPGASLSLQMHHHRAEHWVVVKGTAEVTNGDKTFLLGENESTFIPLGHIHRLANPGKLPLEMIEVQSGSYLGEDDIVRYEDTYGRAHSTGTTLTPAIQLPAHHKEIS